jgi:hypothetical protein
MLVVQAPSLNVNSVLNAKITLPDNSIIEKTLAFDTENYSAIIEADLVGKYHVELTYTYGEKVVTSNYTFNISYLPEYNSFTIFEASNLYYMVSNNGQVSEDGKLVLKNDNSKELKYIYDFTPLFMTICAILVVLDIMIRKLTLNDILSLFRKKDYFKTGGHNNEKTN